MNVELFFCFGDMLNGIYLWFLLQTMIRSTRGVHRKYRVCSSGVFYT